jgi:hypothetical protein
MGFRRCNNNEPSVRNVFPPYNHQDGEKHLGSTKQPAPELFINALLPLQTLSSPDDTAFQQ